MPTATAATARAGSRGFAPLSDRRAHTKVPCNNDLLWETLRVRNHPGQARTDDELHRERHLVRAH
jgi:hypothetical protein